MDYEELVKRVETLEKQIEYLLNGGYVDVALDGSPKFVKDYYHKLQKEEKGEVDHV